VADSLRYPLHKIALAQGGGPLSSCAATIGVHREEGMRDSGKRLCLLLPCILALGGCAMVTVTSEPRSAEITYSLTGTPPWRPWPPGRTKPRLTPAHQSVRAEPYYFVRVSKEGYYPAPPAFVDVGFLRRQKLHFQLEPTSATFAQLQRARGYVLFEGRWVKPAEKGLVEYQSRWMRPADKFKLEQEAKGLVYYAEEKRWMTPKEKEELEAARKQAQGFVRFKGQWLTPREVDIQRGIDQLAQQIAASSPTFPLRIERIGSVFTSDAELRVTDLTGYLLEVLLSGPQSRSALAQPYNSVMIEALPGSYTLVIRQADRPGGLAGVGKVALEPKGRYSATYRGAPVPRAALRYLPRTKEIKIEPVPELPPPIPLPSVREGTAGEKPR